MGWLASLFGSSRDDDSEIAGLIAQRRERRYVSDVIDYKADDEVAWAMFRAGRHDDARAEVKRELDLAPSLTKTQFQQCSAREIASLVAMRRRDLFRQLASFCGFQGATSESVAYGAIAHAWWIAGLALDPESEMELRKARSSDDWMTAVAGDDRLAQVALRHRRAKVDAEVEQLSAELWAAVGLMAEARVRA